MKPKSVQNPLVYDLKINVEKWTSKERYKSTRDNPKEETGPKTVARGVDLGEGGGPGEGVGGGKEGLRTEGGSKPPQPRGLVGFLLHLCRLAC